MKPTDSITLYKPEYDIAQPELPSNDALLICGSKISFAIGSIPLGLVTQVS